MNNRCRGDNWKAEINCILPAFSQCTEGLFHKSLIDSVIHWWTDWLTNWLTDWLTDWPKQWNWRSGFVTDRPPYRDTWERHLPQWSSLWWRGGTVPKTERIKGALKFDGNIFMNKLLVNKWMNRLFSRISLVLLEEWITKIVVVKQANKVVRLIQNWLSWGKLSFEKAVIIFQSKLHWHFSSVTSPHTLLHHSTLVQWKNLHFLKNFITNTGLTSFLFFYSATFVFLLISWFIALQLDCRCARGWILFLWKTNHTWKG